VRDKRTTKFDARVRDFSAPSKPDSFPKGADSFVLVEGTDRGTDPKSRHLHAGLDGLDRMSKVHCKDSGRTPQNYVNEYIYAHRHERKKETDRMSVYRGSKTEENAKRLLPSSPC
jgi:hypothetical protein